MTKQVLIEGVALLAISLVSIAEAVRLMTAKDPQGFNSMLESGVYVLVIAIALMCIAIGHLLNYKNIPGVKKVVVDREMRIRMMSLFGICALYVLLISIIGYLLATFVFFFLVFRVLGIKSWKSNVILALILGGAYYIIFDRYCNMMLPRGIFSWY